ncbi:MFS transporter [Brevibacillus daliensis]|uniref:MFS transporter n=1 Tax=Brevibacillus daliensis TaxID=2892995 RepID=UPI001E3DD7F8|nr:MFS transporter [Brevibacillus daliensis]
MPLSRFYPFLTARSLMTLADVMYIMILTTFVYQQTSSATYAAMLPVLRMVASMSSGFTSPVLVDRVRFTRLLSVLPVSKLVVLLIFTALFDPISQYIGLLFLFVVLISIVDGWTNPILSTVTPRLVENDELVKANSMLSMFNQSISVLGFAFTGVLVVLWGSTIMLILTSAILLISVLFLAVTIKKIEPEEKVQTKKTSWKAMKEGWVILWKNRAVRIVTIMDIVESIAGGVWIGAITLVFVKEILLQNEAWWGYINASYYIGTILGGLLAFTISRYIKKNLVISMAVGSFLFGILTLLYGVNSTPWIALLICVVMGPAYQIRDISQQTILQTSVGIAQLPKVYSAHSIVLSSTTSLSILIIGVISDWYGVRMVYLFSGVGVLLSSCLAFALLPLLRKQKKEQENQTT